MVGDESLDLGNVHMGLRKRTTRNSNNPIDNNEECKYENSQLAYGNVSGSQNDAD